MIDYSKYQTAHAEPLAASMIETFRAIGYNIQTAVADIVDNSISASATNIWIDFQWKGSASWISFRDDGSGMDNEELIQALRPGSKNPNEERLGKDLGRFGLGLKTASFSQCRRLSVISKKREHNIAFWTWDLDFVNMTGKWELIDFLPDNFISRLANTISGTIVIWNEMDRLVKDLEENDKSSLSKFLQVMEQVKKHLEMVFHRFIETKRIKIHFQDREIEPWDPFMISDAATQKLPEDPLQNSKVKVRGFVLPHRSKLTDNEFRKAEGPGGWNEHQGFYIYRNERLLFPGDWLGMFRKEEHYKLARIMIDLPNNLDSEWQIDIKKSIARPPLILRDQLKAYATKVRSQAVEVYRHKGKILQRKYSAVQFHSVWLEKIRHGKRFYEINRDHPLIQSLINSLGKETNQLGQLLRFIEETVPVPLITIRESEQPENQAQPFEGTDLENIKIAMTKMFEMMVVNGRSSEQAKATILNIEPFNLFPFLIDHIN